MNEVEIKKKKVKKPLSVNLDNTHYQLIHSCVEEMGWKVTSSTTANTLFWVDAEGCSDIITAMKPYQFVNHFPLMAEIAHKVELAKNYDKMSKFLPDIYTFHPHSFILPREAKILKEYMYSIPKKSNRTIIIKPDTGSQGKGIKLIQNPNLVDDYYDDAVAQKYIEPYLIDGYKFDLRIYVLVTHISPLRIYIHNEGMARFCSEPYKPPKSSNLDEVYGHLTNFSLNKKCENFQTNDTDIAPETGSKRTLTSIFNKLKENSVDVKILQDKIDNIIRYTIASIASQLKIAYSSKIFNSDNKCRCFEILGFDILIDKDVNPWLIEVNTVPSLQTGSPFDESLKRSAVIGAMKIIDLKKTIKSRYKKALKNCNMKERENICSFDPVKETEISKTTNWRLIYPVSDNPSVENTMEQAIKFSERMFIKDNKSSTIRKQKQVEVSKAPVIEKKPKSAPVNRPKPTTILKPLNAEKPVKDCNKATQKLSVYQREPVKTRKVTILPKFEEKVKVNLCRPSLSKPNTRQSSPVLMDRYKAPLMRRNIFEFDNQSIFSHSRYFPREIISISEEENRKEILFQREESAQLMHLRSKIRLIFDALQKK
ncbi:Tubulin-tyrosine ligase family protein [Trichomonas vaginalis G3]|uniref:Tubulin-tyrosine ligase family protein n=1 Tax=Trichomonas vaginalis (strain ATCC PRA-98 / G3) TaxID=412133 RepID=A2FWM1_TRIV3|nr:positive regulation of cilium movement [Trichomonas vaginalis G3]EAX90681.1 Tubulin-tyrosine ligase family protein [Trichomonas vaginalis G3]KAI5530981.1 positive regulation of cilium movement [Trichomonas vaginalis G3]|eukprot:XP_001303611.1 Tubulin-tyrosine ligase family protein [Trichomonas vaginalis G3]